MLRKSAQRFLRLSAIGVFALTMTVGCRAVPGRNWLGMRNQPSPDVLAGSGPSTTYPAPPSASATPQAIASVAGGTTPPNPVTTDSPTTAQVAGIDISPGFATPASGQSTATNFAAAQANGALGGPQLDPSLTAGGVTAPSTSQSGPSGYTFGSKTFTPKPYSGASGSIDSLASDSNTALPSTGFTVPSTTSTPTSSATIGDLQSSPMTSANVSDSGGFTLPTDPAALANLAAPQASPSTAAPSTEMGVPGGVAIPSNSTTALSPPTEVAAEDTGSPTFSTAQRDPDGSASSTSDSGYMPGSTAESSGYPAGSPQPSTQGSFYR